MVGTAANSSALVFNMARMVGSKACAACTHSPAGKVAVMANDCGWTPPAGQASRSACSATRTQTAGPAAAASAWGAAFSG